jgi:hypothetical protein
MIQALVISAIEEGEHIISELMTEDPRTTLQNLIQWFFKEMRERMDHWRLLTELTLKIEKFEFVHDLVTLKMNEYVHILEKQLTQLGYKDPLGEARMISALFDGMGIQALMVREDYPLDEMESFLINKYCTE